MLLYDLLPQDQKKFIYAPIPLSPSYRGGIQAKVNHQMLDLINYLGNTYGEGVLDFFDQLSDECLSDKDAVTTLRYSDFRYPDLLEYLPGKVFDTSVLKDFYVGETTYYTAGLEKVNLDLFKEKLDSKNLTNSEIRDLFTQPDSHHIIKTIGSLDHDFANKYTEAYLEIMSRPFVEDGYGLIEYIKERSDDNEFIDGLWHDTNQPVLGIPGVNEFLLPSPKTLFSKDIIPDYYDSLPDTPSYHNTGIRIHFGIRTKKDVDKFIANVFAHPTKSTLRDIVTCPDGSEKSVYFGTNLDEVYTQVTDDWDSFVEFAPYIHNIDGTFPIYDVVNLLDNVYLDVDKVDQTVSDNIEYLQSPLTKYNKLFDYLENSSVEELRSDNIPHGEEVKVWLEDCLLYQNYKEMKAQGKLVNTVAKPTDHIWEISANDLKAQLPDDYTKPDINYVPNSEVLEEFHNKEFEKAVNMLTMNRGKTI